MEKEPRGRELFNLMAARKQIGERKRPKTRPCLSQFHYLPIVLRFWNHQCIEPLKSS
jgi:hypothetical protein